MLYINVISVVIMIVALSFSLVGMANLYFVLYRGWYILKSPLIELLGQGVAYKVVTILLSFIVVVGSWYVIIAMFRFIDF